MKIYHASQIKNLKLLKPSKTLSHNKNIGNYLFGTSDLLLAYMYLTPKGIPILMNPGYKRPTIVICSTIDNLKNKDKGGSIYVFDSKYFKKSPQAELSEYEVVSTKALEPDEIYKFDSVLEALKHGGIDIKVVNNKVFNMLIENPRQKELIEKLPNLDFFD